MEQTHHRAGGDRQRRSQPSCRATQDCSSGRPTAWANAWTC